MFFFLLRFFKICVFRGREFGMYFVGGAAVLPLLKHLISIIIIIIIIIFFPSFLLPLHSFYLKGALGLKSYRHA